MPGDNLLGMCLQWPRTIVHAVLDGLLLHDVIMLTCAESAARPTRREQRRPRILTSTCEDRCFKAMKLGCFSLTTTRCCHPLARRIVARCRAPHCARRLLPSRLRQSLPQGMVDQAPRYVCSEWRRRDPRRRHRGACVGQPGTAIAERHRPTSRRRCLCAVPA